MSHLIDLDNVKAYVYKIGTPEEQVFRPEEIVLVTEIREIPGR